LSGVSSFLQRFMEVFQGAVDLLFSSLLQCARLNNFFIEANAFINLHTAKVRRRSLLLRRCPLRTLRPTMVHLACQHSGGLMASHRRHITSMIN